MTSSHADYFGAETITTSIGVNTTECQVRRTPAFLVFSILPTVSIITNLIPFLAIFMHRHKLRQNNVYYHVGNTLLTNVIFSLLSLYQILSLYFALDGYRDRVSLHTQGAVRDDARIWWAFYRAMLTGIFLVMCCNIGVLVSSIRDSTHGPLLFGSRALELSSNEQWSLDEGRKLAKMLSKFDRKRRHRRAWLYIFIVWLLPLCYVISAPLGWSCAWACHCLSGCYHALELNSFSRRTCSRVWPPMQHDWLFVGVTAWLFCVIVVIAILWRAISDTKRHFLFCHVRVSRHSKCNVIASGERSGDVTSQSDATIEAMTYVKSPRHNSLVKSHQVLGRTLSSLRYLIWITVLFVVCTAPVMALMFVDYLSTNNPSMILGNGCLCVPFAYCWICPFLLARCLPGIRSALSALLLRICERRTMTQQTNIPGNSRRRRRR